MGQFHARDSTYPFFSRNQSHRFVKKYWYGEGSPVTTNRQAQHLTRNQLFGLGASKSIDFESVPERQIADAEAFKIERHRDPR